MAVALSNSFPSGWRLLVGNLVIITGLVGLAGFSAYESRLHYQERAHTSLSNLSETLSRNLTTVIEKTDLSLRTIALEIDREMARQGSVDSEVLAKVLAEQKSLQPDIYSLRIADAEGIIRFGTGVLPGSSISVVDRDYFLRLRGDPRAGLFISEPYVGRIANDRWIVVLARRLERPDGAFGGVVYAVITTDHFREMLSSLDLGPNGSVTLQTEKRHLIARVPEPKEDRAMGDRVLLEPSDGTLKLYPLQGMFTSISPLDQIERHYVYRRVSSYPLFIVVGRATQDEFSAWRQEVVRLAVVVAAFSLLTLVLLLSAQRAAQRQQIARRLFQEAVESIDAGFAIFDREDRLVICNEAYRRLHPASRHFLVPGVRFEDIVRNKAASEFYPEAQRSPEAWVQERLRRHRLADGTAIEQRTDNGRQLLTIEHRTASGYVVGNQMDITDLARYRDRLEQLVEERTRRLEAALGQFRILVEQAPTAIAMLDTNMNYLAASARWVQEYGRNLDSLIGRHHYEAHPDLPEEWKEAHRAALAGMPQERKEMPWVRADGSRHWINWAVYPWRDEEGVIGGIIIAGDDVTDRKKAEEEVQRLNANLERQVEIRTAELAQSNEALLRSNIELQNFAHAAAHDLQTPLRSIVSFTQLLQHTIEGVGDEQAREWSSQVIDNAKRLQVLIQELLRYTRLDAQSLPFEEVDLREIFDEVVASLKVLIEETDADVRASPLPTLSVDRVQIAQVLQNLIENGIKYNQSMAPEVSVSCEFQHDRWLFSVADNGVGIDPKHHERIFEMFRRLHTYQQVAGSGIGLALCRRIVERHGGRIWVESRPGEGSTFYFTLPGPNGRG